LPHMVIPLRIDADVSDDGSTLRSKKSDSAIGETWEGSPALTHPSDPTGLFEPAGGFQLRRVHVQISNDGISASARSNVLPTLADDGCHSIIELYFFIRTQNWRSILLVDAKKLRHAALDSAHISDGRFRPSQRRPSIRLNIGCGFSSNTRRKGPTPPNLYRSDKDWEFCLHP
jgi:hypothetical protein